MNSFFFFFSLIWLNYKFDLFFGHIFIFETKEADSKFEKNQEEIKFTPDYVSFERIFTLRHYGK